MEDSASLSSEQARAIILKFATDPDVVKIRTDTAAFAAKTLSTVGDEMHLAGHIIGTDRIDAKSTAGHGSDEAVGISLILRIGGQLTSASAQLLLDGRGYAGAALLRQLVEVEYLAWAFESRDGDAEKWLRSDRKTREDFFRPAKLRKAAEGKFRGKDYGDHCESGGHPTPTARMLLSNDGNIPQLYLSDLLGHVGRIWDHMIGWARKSTLHGQPILARSDAMLDKFRAWKQADPLAHLPGAPE